MGPIALSAVQVYGKVGSFDDDFLHAHYFREKLIEAQHFVIDGDVWLTAWNIVRSEVSLHATKSTSEEDILNHVFEYRMPAATCAIETSDYLLLLQEKEGRVACHIISSINSNGRRGFTTDRGHVFTITQRSSQFDISANGVELDRLNAGPQTHILALQLDAILSLIAEPKIVRTAPIARSFRKRSLRELGLPKEADVKWNTVSWVIGSDKRDTVGEIGRGSPKALHFSRAHWRRAIEGQPKAEIRPESEGYWTWVAASWKGDPRYGIRLHDYTPKIGSKGGV